MSQPLVSVICLCYNHEQFVEEAIESVFQQNYFSIQLIVVDDCSNDKSSAVIRKVIKERADVVFIANDENKGSCKSFNSALKVAKGEYLIDLAADDVLLPDRIAIGVAALEKAGSEYGVQFTDAEIISENGSHLYLHSEKFTHNTIPQGDIYKDLIERYFICSPTMIFRKEVIDNLNGYDETLTFEDFDFWIRSARTYKYCYSPQALLKKRVVNNSMSQVQFTKGNKQRWSTLAVCKKIKDLNKSSEEDHALRKRLRYEIFLSLRMMDIRLAVGFLKLRMAV